MTAARHNLVGQQLHLGRHFPESAAVVRRDELVWRGKLQPTPLSANYVVRIKYKLGATPLVHVVHPTLERMGDEDPPHRYRDASLCLFWPKRREWTADMLIATTTVPWASEWLAHYEVWLACGQWCGGGKDH